MPCTPGLADGNVGKRGDTQGRRGACEWGLAGSHGWGVRAGPGAAGPDRAKGPRRRQRDTYRHIREAAQEAGHSLPEPQLIEDFDEIDIQAVTDEAMARVLPSCPDLREQIRKQELTDAGREAMRHYGGVVRALLKRWAAQDLDFIETFDAFYARVSAALSQVMRDQGRGKNVAVVTSGGPVCMAVRLALAFDPSTTVDLMWIVHNASITRFKFTEDRFTLTGFNGIGHLREAELLTHV